MGILTDLIQRVPSALIASCIALAIVYVPGFAILERFAAFMRIGLLSRMLIAPGVSIALYIILFVACYELNIPLGAGTPWLVMLVALALLLFDVRNRRLCLRVLLNILLHRPVGVIRNAWRCITLNDRLAYLALGMCVIVALVARIYVVRHLIAPAGSDSVHHTLIVQLLLENNGLFQSWLPYVESSSFTYHFGFHALTAMYAWMRNISAEFAVIMMGQIISATTVFALYALVRLWLKTAWGAVFAVIAASVLFTYPALFADYGRFTQLVGQMALISTLVLLSTFLAQHRCRGNLAYFVILPIVIAGLGLAQYQVAVIFILLAIPLMMTHLIRWLRRGQGLPAALMLSFGRAAALGILALFIFLPRGLDALNSQPGTRVYNSLTMPGPEVRQGYFAIPEFIPLTQTGIPNQHLWVWWLALAGVVIAILMRRQALWLCVGIGLCVIVMNPRMIGIPRVGLIDAVHLSFTFFLFSACLAGLAGGALSDLITRKQPRFARAALISAVALTYVGVTQYPPITPRAELVYPDDLRVMNCIRDRVPDEEQIAVRAAFYFNSTVLMGDEAGWWIPYYTGHRINLLPLESGVELEKRRESIQFFRDMVQRDLSTTESAQWLKSKGLHYFFIGAKPVEFMAPEYSITADQIRRNPDVSTVCQSGAAQLLVID